MHSKKGFTLIEILVAMAIVSILASVVLVSMGSYRIKANAAKIDASLSSAAASMMTCWSMGGYVLEPAAGSNICTFTTTSTSAYGVWPDVSSLAANYEYSESNAKSVTDCPECLPPNFVGYIEEKNIIAKPTLLDRIMNSAHASAVAPSPKGLPKADWYFSAQNTSDKKKICCNKKMNSCKEIDSSTLCSASIN